MTRTSLLAFSVGNVQRSIFRDFDGVWSMIFGSTDFGADFLVLLILVDCKIVQNLLTDINGVKFSRRGRQRVNSTSGVDKIYLARFVVGTKLYPACDRKTGRVIIFITRG